MVFGLLLFLLLPGDLTNKNLPGEIILQIVSDTAKIKFEQTTISFDTITAGEKIKKEFVFKNAGKQNLVIEEVLASDGGTMAFWPEHSILPGEKNKIVAEFGFTETRSGYQDKLFTVISNAENSPVILHLVGYIKEKR